MTLTVQNQSQKCLLHNLIDLCLKPLKITIANDFSGVNNFFHLKWRKIMGKISLYFLGLNTIELLLEHIDIIINLAISIKHFISLGLFELHGYAQALVSVLL